MERGSDKHGSRLDDALAHDTQSIVQGAGGEARADEGREQEGPGDGEPTPDARLAGGRLTGDGTRPTDDELEARSELARHLDPSVFPADGPTLAANAEGKHAPGWILDALRSLPDGRYPTTESVWEALGGTVERRA